MTRETRGKSAGPNTSPANKPPKKQSEISLRRQVIEIALEMSRTGLSPGRSGNVSCRWKSGMLITPSGMAYEDIKPRDIVFVDADGSVAGDASVSSSARIPSSEWRFHLAAYEERPDKHAIVHTHSMHATVLACAHKPIPAFHYMVAAAGGMDVPLVPYATFGTGELSDHVRAGLRNRNACLMANHGQIVLGDTLKGAFDLACEVEELAEQYFKVLLLGTPQILGDEEMARVLEKFETYGQKG